MKIALVGYGSEIFKALENIHIPNDLEIVVIDREEEKPPTYFKPDIEDFIIQQVPRFDYEKQFICKGKHQYREVREQKEHIIKSYWICQCGRKIND